MPVLQRDDAEIYFEELGSGYPVLLFAPGGLRSRIEMWHPPPEGPARPWNDWTDELASRYRVVAMDQRNAGRSRGAIAADHGWHTYAADHLALMDHVGYERFHTLGGCIGSSYCLKLCGPRARERGGVAKPDRAPSRVSELLSGEPCRLGQ
jgi:pimeloyl-ACP methyl ester carboxylesterase